MSVPKHIVSAAAIVVTDDNQRIFVYADTNKQLHFKIKVKKVEEIAICFEQSLSYYH